MDGSNGNGGFAAGFDIERVLRAALLPVMCDFAGCWHAWVPNAGSVTIDVRGRTAHCDLVFLVTEHGGFAPEEERWFCDQRLELGADGAETLIRLLVAIGQRRAHDDAPSPTIADFQSLLVGDLSESGVLPGTFFTGITELTAGVPRAPALANASDVLHPLTLAQTLLAGTLVHLPAPGANWTGIVYGERSLTLLPGRTEDEVRLVCLETMAPFPGAELGHAMPRSSALSALMALEGLRCVARTKAVTPGVDARQAAAIRSELETLLSQALAEGGVGIGDGCRRTAAQFGPGLPARTASWPPSRLTSGAMTAIRRWVARRGQASFGDAIDIRRVEQYRGEEIERRGDGFVMRCRWCVIVFRVEVDVAAGWIDLLQPDGSFSGPAVFSATTLEWIARAFRADGLCGTAAIRAATGQVLLEPLTDPYGDAQQVIVEALRRVAEADESDARRTEQARWLLSTYPDA